MSLRFCLLGSGSKGNSLYLANGNQAVLIDCGLSARQAWLRMEAAGLFPPSVKAIIVTHEHRDHIAGVRVLSKRLRCPVLATPATWQAALQKDASLTEVRREQFEAGRGFELAGITLRSFSISHDAADPVGFVASCGAARLGLATDLGEATRLVKARLAGCQGLILESNHDLGMLAKGPYHEWLKQRVRSRHGHLSNQQSAELVQGLAGPELRQLVLAHLSEINNQPHLAGRAASQALDSHGCRAGLTVAGQAKSTPLMEL